MRIIAGAYKGRVLKTTVGPGFRPAMGKVREALFSMLEAKGVDWRSARVLDLFAGSGSLGFEALSRGAAYVCFVENAPYAARVINANAKLLGADGNRVDIRAEDVAKVLQHRPSQGYSVIFIDPPYAADVLTSTLHALLQNQWALPGTLINAEVEARRSFAPEKAHPALETLVDRAYGQTRVILWNVKKE